MLHPSAKIKLQLFPLDQRIREGLEKDGHNPFLELTLKARKKISSVIEHLGNKWGSSSIAVGELMLFPCAAVDNLTSYKGWASCETGISAGDVHAAIGSPDNFQLRYGWVSTQPNSSTSTPSLGCADPGQLERVLCSTMETTVGSKIHTEVKSKESEPHHQTEEPRMQNDLSFLWSDLSNISIGGLLSEASLQGRFNPQDMKLGRGRSVSQPSAVVFDSLDAFIDQLKGPQDSCTLSPNMPSSILDAEDTCHSFAFSKLSSSGKDFLSLGRSPFSELSNQDVASRPFKCPKSETNSEDGVAGSNAVQEPKTDPSPCSVGIYNNENSLGLSSIRWNDSLGPFDLPLTSRQIIKDDSISIGGFVR